MNELETWIRGNMWHGELFAPELLDDQVALFDARFVGPMALLFLKGFDANSHWRVPGITVESIFGVLAEIAGGDGLHVFGIVNPDDAISEFSGAAVAQPRYVGAWNLFAFEQPVEQNGARWQCYVSLKKRWILTFHRRNGFSVQCFGNKQFTNLFIENCRNWKANGVAL